MGNSSNRVQTYLDFLKGNTEGLKVLKEAEKAQNDLTDATVQGAKKSEAELKKVTALQEKFNKALVRRVEFADFSL